MATGGWRSLPRIAEYHGRRLQQWRRVTLPFFKCARSIALPNLNRAGGGSEVSLVAICKDEGPYIREWVEFHRNVGFHNILVYDNGSTDNTLDKLADLATDGGLTVVPWPHFDRHRNTQTLAYHHAVAYLADRSKWIALLDIDEFLFPLAPVKIADALRDYEDVPSLSLPWHNYGSSGHLAPLPGRVTENYLHRAPFPPPRWKNTLLHYKSLVRPEFVESLSNHFPNLVRQRAYFYTERKERVHKANYINPRYASSDIFRLNHYFSKSQAEFWAKAERGPVSRRSSGWRKIDRYRMIEDETVFDDVAARKWATF